MVSIFPIIPFLFTAGAFITWFELLAYRNIFFVYDADKSIREDIQKVVRGKRIRPKGTHTCLWCFYSSFMKPLIDFCWSTDATPVSDRGREGTEVAQENHVRARDLSPSSTDHSVNWIDMQTHGNPCFANWTKEKERQYVRLTESTCFSCVSGASYGYVWNGKWFLFLRS